MSNRSCRFSVVLRQERGETAPPTLAVFAKNSAQSELCTVCKVNRIVILQSERDRNVWRSMGWEDLGETAPPTLAVFEKKMQSSNLGRPSFTNTAPPKLFCLGVIGVPRSQEAALP